MTSDSPVQPVSPLHDSPPARTIVLWGDCRAGKTTVLTTAFFGEPSRLPEIDRQASANTLSQHIFPDWQRLHRGRAVRPGGAAPRELVFMGSDGHPIRIVELPGQWAGQLQDPEVRRWLQAADAILFAVAWGAPDADHIFSAISGASSLCQNRPKALVFTRTECSLPEESAAWNRPESWWQAHPWSMAHAEVIARFAPAVWPVSAYGYHAESGYPAVLIGKFGQLLPHGIRPRNVSAPFEWLMNQMPSWSIPPLRPPVEAQ